MASLAQHVKPEFPPYKFYHSPTDTKYETWSVPVDEKFNVLRLLNITLSPIDARSGLTLEIEVESGKEKQTHRFNLPELFYNPRLPENLFFTGDPANKEYTDIELPQGRKNVTYRIVPHGVEVEFEMSLTCRYL